MHGRVYTGEGKLATAPFCRVSTQRTWYCTTNHSWCIYLFGYIQWGFNRGRILFFFRFEGVLIHGGAYTRDFMVSVRIPKKSTFMHVLFKRQVNLFYSITCCWESVFLWSILIIMFSTKYLPNHYFSWSKIGKGCSFWQTSSKVHFLQNQVSDIQIFTWENCKCILYWPKEQVAMKAPKRFQ